METFQNLFFNTDLDGAIEKDEKGDFIGYNDDALKEEAQLFLNCLERLNVNVPTVDELLTDFYKRQ